VVSLLFLVVAEVDVGHCFTGAYKKYVLKI